MNVSLSYLLFCCSTVQYLSPIIGDIFMPYKNIQELIQNVRRRRLEAKTFIDDYKRQHPCIKCGEADIACLQFHHLQAKNECISDCIHNGWSIERIKYETTKCIVLCANCHLKSHKDDYLIIKNPKQGLNSKIFLPPARNSQLATGQ